MRSQKSALEHRLPKFDPLAAKRCSIEEFTLKPPTIFKEKAFINQGTFGLVYQAKIGDTLYALKKIKMDTQQQGFPITSIREIMVLRQLTDHPNIV